ncbi:MAG: DJ-1/PfpI family protein [Clostridiales bacterium]|jgi:4-methyl-5(b-hydroxyethyl)-thiazole monophosphate biosynthesis|nr:DJ-1/PfpI family protein [Clostridiales bacterium]
MVYLFLAQGFEEVEALTPVDLLRRASIPVTTVGIGGKVICGAHGIPVETDVTEQDFSKCPADLEMLVLPGGMPGAKNLDESPIVQAALSFAVENNRYIAAICAAPMIPGKRGLLQGRHAVCYPGFEKDLHGAILEKTGVVRDGMFITGKAAGYAGEFALALIEALRGSDVANAVREAIYP